MCYRKSQKGTREGDKVIQHVQQFDQVRSQSDEAFSPVQGVNDENSKHLGSGFGGQKGME